MQQNGLELAMKTLFVLRHAQAVHFGDTSDHDRPLTERGVQDAMRMGRLFRGMRPSQVLCSTAKRAVDTAEAVLKVSGTSIHKQTLRQLYDSDLNQHLEILRSVATAIDQLLIVGHNPTFECLVSMIVHRPIVMKTGSLAVVALPIEQWDALNDAVQCSLVGLFYPAMLKKQLDDRE
jgi:phosphohistidine phosphatase